MTENLLLCSLRPVEKYISQVGRLSDLYAGSQILLQLSSKIAGKLVEKYDLDFVYPSDLERGSFPNQFLLKGKINLKEEELDEQMKKYWYSAVDDLLAEHLPFVDNKKDIRLQIIDYFSFNWVYYIAGTETYGQAYADVHHKFRAIKSGLGFNQLVSVAGDSSLKKGEIGHKCSVCKEYNALFYNIDQEHEKTFEDIGPGSEELKEELKIDNLNKRAVNLNGRFSENYLAGNEVLCAVCFLKRCFGLKQQRGYKSRAEAALNRVISSLQEETDFNVNDYRDLFSDFDYKFFYPENVKQDLLGESGNTTAANNIGEVRQERKRIEEKIKQKNFRFPRYYAMLIFDGDNVGRWMSGEFLNEESDLFSFQKRLADILDEFNSYVASFLKGDKGSLVYAGGDDLLALTNIFNLFELLKKLRENYPGFMELMDSNIEQSAAASCGVVIAHYKYPLSKVIKRTRKMVQEAKEFDNFGQKNSLAIELIKDSASRRKIIFPWHFYSKNIIKSLLKIVELMRKNILAVEKISSLKERICKLSDQEDISDSKTGKIALLEALNEALLAENGGQQETVLYEEVEEITDNLLSATNLSNVLSAFDIICFLQKEVINYAGD